MLHDQVTINIQDFVSIFSKKFTNFCRRSPVDLSFVIGGYSVKIYHLTYNLLENGSREKILVLDYEFDFSLNVKENIHIIKEFLLENIYPVYQEVYVVEEKYDPKEMNEMIKRGEITTDDIGPRGIYKPIMSLWRPERILINDDKIFIRQMSTNRVHMFKAKIPVTILVKNMATFKEKKPGEAWNYLRSKTTFLGKVYDSNVE